MTLIETPDSSSIGGYAYNPSKLILTVEYKHGGTYEYYDVPESVFHELEAAQSKGQYVVWNVRDKFRYMRIS